MLVMPPQDLFREQVIEAIDFAQIFTNPEFVVESFKIEVAFKGSESSGNIYEWEDLNRRIKRVNIYRFSSSVDLEKYQDPRALPQDFPQRRKILLDLIRTELEGEMQPEHREKARNDYAVLKSCPEEEMNECIDFQSLHKQYLSDVRDLTNDIAQEFEKASIKAKLNSWAVTFFCRNLANEINFKKQISWPPESLDMNESDIDMA